MVELRVGTRASTLAVTQTRWVCDRLKDAIGEVTIREHTIQTDGDRFTKPLSQSPTPGLFVSALRASLLNGDVDVIVHSMKDVPSYPEPGITLACVPDREDVRDALISREGHTLDRLPAGSLVGTSSPRRQVSVLAARPDLRVESIRGNVETRIRKVMDGDYDATLLAVAGLKRAGLTNHITQILPTDTFLPAPRQGALAVECRSDDREVLAMLAVLDDVRLRLATEAERAVVEGVGAGCSTAIGALATWRGSTLHVVAELGDPETNHIVRMVSRNRIARNDVSAAGELGFSVAAKLRGTDVFRKVIAP
jgi:hydroxymethylbilane synthase